MNRVKSTLLRSSGIRKMLIRVLNIGIPHVQPGGTDCYLDSSAGASGAAAGVAAAAGASPASAAIFLAGFSRGMNFFLTLGNSKFSPLRFCAAPPSSVILAWADLLYQPA